MSCSPTCSSIIFRQTDLPRLLRGIAARTRVFLCCEPRRSALPLAGSHLVGLLGAGPVTRQDAVSSVHAGFRGAELSDLWPDPQRLGMDEYPAGLFSHCFLAVRKDAIDATKRYDAIIVGGGPSGATAAMLLAQAGWRVAVVEKAPFPRRKVCGEFISATTWPLLRQLGVAGPLLRTRRTARYAASASTPATRW